MTLSNSCSFVKVGLVLSEPFNTVHGFRQGFRRFEESDDFLLGTVLC